MAAVRQTVRSLWVIVPLFAVLLAGCGGSHAVTGSGVSISVESGHTQTAVPKVVGETSRDAVRELHTAGFSVRERHQNVGGSRSGVVLSQDPRHGQVANTGSIVRITVGR
jgi:beta-lactam-binding protein with PASTA domain